MAIDQTVHVVHPEYGRLHVEELGERSVDEWIGDVEDKKCGWAEKQYGLALHESAERALDHDESEVQA